MRARFVWDIRDLTWEYAREQARSTVERVLARLMASIMWSISRRADLVITATEGIRVALVSKGLQPERVLVAPNYPSRTILTAVSPERESATPAVRPRVLYAGLIGRNQGLDVLLDVAAHSPSLHFELAGDGPERSRLESEARLRGLSNVTFLGFLSVPELAAAYRRADVLFAKICDTETLSRDSVPSKLYEYMAARRPIVFAGRGAAAEALTSSGTAVVVPPTDREAIATAIDDLVHDAGRRAQLVRRAWLHVASGPFREDVMTSVAASIVQLGASRRR
jgi:glycosyltransferase involved in cell wall biosynthesis